ncbi:MAG: hypothetical protein JRG80_04900 [Deltaproteobacteria bacterium]|nr:hypothetical protein [Deltaproteobacteria bacterium]MBW2398594.1 hypothetical protein [Deltaproteobacteria bacterium]MBW2667437.1 hypothetical protein [Deltaproteobacteria bacterium]
MAQQATIVQESVDRVREAMSSLESDFEKVQKRAEKKFKAQRKSLEKRTEKQVDRLRKEFNKNPYVKRAQSAVDDVTTQIEKNVDSLLETLNVASQSDLRRVNSKLSKINKKLRELEKSSTAP